MPDPSRLCDSTRIALPREVIVGLEAQLDERFMGTVSREDDVYCRIIGSPVEIKGEGEFLARQGVSLQ